MYYPDSYMACMHTRNNLKVTSEAMLKCNWMTKELIEEIETHYHQTEHFITERFKTLCKGNISPFSHYCPNNVPKGPHIC